MQDVALIGIEFCATSHVCKVVMEACAGTYHMARLLAGDGHEVD